MEKFSCVAHYLFISTTIHHNEGILAGKVRHTTLEFQRREEYQMTKLDCNVVSCSYNEDNCCRRSDIQVEGTDAHTPSETSCGSFVPRGCGCNRNELGEPAKATAVACEAVECRFNREKKCSADHIGIAGGHADSGRETECGSFSHSA